MNLRPFARRLLAEAVWYLPAIAFGALLAAHSRPSAPAANSVQRVACPGALSADVARAIFDELRRSDGGGCTFEGIESHGDAAAIRWSRGGVVFPSARMTAGQCVVTATGIAPQLAVEVPPELRDACPVAAQRTVAAVSSSPVVARLRTRPSVTTVRIPLRLAKVSWFAAAIALMWIIRTTLRGLRD